MIQHRRLRGALFVTLFAALAAIPAFAQDGTPFLDYRTESWFMPQSPSVTAGPVGGLFNPAVWALNDKAGTDMWWNETSLRKGLDNYGFGMGKNLNFAMNTTTWGTEQQSFKTYDYQLGLAAGNRLGAFGMNYRWARGGHEGYQREQTLGIGLATRAKSWSSFGASANLSLESSAAQYVFDLGIRPLGRHWLTVFGDWTVNDGQVFFSEGAWGAGVEVRPISGIHLGARFRERPGTDTVDYSLIAGLTLGSTNLTALPFYDDAKGGWGTTPWLVRTHPPFPGVKNSGKLFDFGKTYHPVNLENKVLTYQKYRYFDDKRVAWLDLLKLLNHLLEDDQVDGIALNLAGFKARPSLAWELRVKLQEFRDAGKPVMIHGDRFEPLTYFLASVADRVTIDPQGAVALPGFALRRSYLKGTLEKIGVGFQEFRYFEYKSAMETFSRDSMSDADREQRQRIIDVIYETTRAGVMEDRDIGEAEFDRIVDERGLILAHEALDLGLVDAVARWNDLGEHLRGEKIRLTAHGLGDLGHEYWDEQWGMPAVIPVVYAVGPCAMDSGIKGRKTSAYLRRLAKDPYVKAVVLRADSPGGDGLPSDLVAEAVQILRMAGKPVIVSQGDVAASGGYWISMNGSEILTTPLTVTGSIGVIGGWLWDDGLTGKLGITSDVVQRGKHADLFGTVNLPFLGGIPARPMDEEELARAKETVMASYEDFLGRVAAGRGMTRDEVHAVAQGRVWMGGDALEHGLVDRIGTLDQAIDLALDRAGVADWRQVEIREYPPRPAIQWPTFGPEMPGFFGLGDMVNGMLMKWYGLEEAEAALMAVDPFVGAPGLTGGEVDYLRSVAERPGEPLLALPPDHLPEAWQDVD